MDDRTLGFGMEANVEMSDADIPETEFKRRRWYHRRDLRFIGLVALVLAVFFSYGYVTGPAKISDKLNAAISSDGGNAVNIQITARFPPEAFHMGIYQKVGSMRGSEGSVTRINRVKPSDIEALSRKYWVVGIDLGPPTPPRR